MSKMANGGRILHLVCLGTAQAPPRPSITALDIYVAQGRLQPLS